MTPYLVRRSRQSRKRSIRGGPNQQQPLWPRQQGRRKNVPFAGNLIQSGIAADLPRCPWREGLGKCCACASALTASSMDIRQENEGLSRGAEKLGTGRITTHSCTENGHNPDSLLLNSPIHKSLNPVSLILNGISPNCLHPQCLQHKTSNNQSQ